MQLVHDIACPLCGAIQRPWKDAEGFLGYCPNDHAKLTLTAEPLPAESGPVEPALVTSEEQPPAAAPPEGEAASPVPDPSPDVPASENAPEPAFGEPPAEPVNPAPQPDVPA